jgi:hypothetical protein
MLVAIILAGRKIQMTEAGKYKRDFGTNDHCE